MYIMRFLKTIVLKISHGYRIRCEFLSNNLLDWTHCATIIRIFQSLYYNIQIEITHPLGFQWASRPFSNGTGWTVRTADFCLELTESKGPECCWAWLLARPCRRENETICQPPMACNDQSSHSLITKWKMRCQYDFYSSTHYTFWQCRGNRTLILVV